MIGMKKLCVTACTSLILFGGAFSSTDYGFKADAASTKSVQNSAVTSSIKPTQKIEQVIVKTKSQVGKTTITSCSISTSKITIKWKKAKGATGYYMYRYSSVSKKWSRVADTKALTYTDKGLASSSVYKYKVKPYKTVKGKKYINDISPIYTTVTRPKAVNPKVTVSKNNKITFKWNKVKCDGYKLYSYKNKKWKVIKSISKNSTSCTINGKAGTNYKFIIKPVKRAGKNLYGSVNNKCLTVITKETAPVHKHEYKAIKKYVPAHTEKVLVKAAYDETINYYKYTATCICGNEYSMVVDEAKYKELMEKDGKIVNMAFWNLGDHIVDERTKNTSAFIEHKREITERYLVEKKGYTYSYLKTLSYSEIWHLFDTVLDEFDRWDIDEEVNAWGEANLPTHTYFFNGEKVKSNSEGYVSANMAGSWEYSHTEIVHHDAVYTTVSHKAEYVVDHYECSCGAKKSA